MKRNSHLILFCLFLAGGILLSLAPIQVPDGVDKVYHFVGFALVTTSAISTFISFFGKKYIDSFLIFLLAFGGVFAGMSEFAQKFVALRSCNVEDWITNLCGITLVVVISFLSLSKEKTKVELNSGRFEFKDLPAAF